MRLRNLALAFVSLSSPVLADAPLGITASEFRLGLVQQDTGAAQASLGPITSTKDLHPTLGFAAVNVAVTEHHGLQGDAHFEDGPDGAVGRIGAHLFMTPQPGQKYGLYGMLADIDGEAVTYGGLGVEGILSLGPATVVELRGGIGGATAKGLDWITAGGRLSTTVLGTTTLYADYTVTEFEEPDIDTLSHDLTLGLDTRLTRSLGLFAAATANRLEAMDVADELTLRAGLIITFGNWGGADARTHPFTTTDPVAALIRRGYF